ncbi:hypothetical protein [Phenylobacterium sp. 58.2.17]|uniref:hypothetical protein n=1 Tax=Phenylobacterium sp. 58.2.17 TaxID=2969306 RepID=UPI00226502D1|nr:hypothetical protein [Phenylobacterium sp. 58.2.17]MCX7586551.1 hypothetical protein [Phenylobacterium sp. 58.2.17]
MAFDGEAITEEEWAKLRRDAVTSLPAALVGKSLPDILMPSQKALLMATASEEVVVCDKSRRVGFTWAAAADSVLTAGAAKSAGGMDVLYIGTSFDMAREFIDACAMWARAFMPACTDVGEFLFTDQEKGQEDRQIQAFRIRFASGFEIVALSSRPRSLRGRQGYVILDEYAFHDDAPALLKAAMALLIRGGKVLVISTHNGADNPFNELITDIRAKKRPGAVVRCTFDEAIEEGLYQRICLMQGKEWSPEIEAAWRKKIYAYHGADADEELRCIPSQGSGIYLTRALIESCMTSGGVDQVLRLKCPAGFELKSKTDRQSYVQAWLEQVVQPELDKLDPNLRHAFGQDFALTGDVSAYVPLAIDRDLTRRVPFVIEMRNVPYDQQKQIVFWVTKRLPRFTAGKLDATGNGASLAQETMQEFGPERIEEVHLSQSWYLNNMPPLKAAFEDRTIATVKHSDHVDDLRQIRLIRGVPMVPRDIRTTGTDGLQRHGDVGIALALGFAATWVDVGEYAYHRVEGRDLGNESALARRRRENEGGGFSRFRNWTP